MKNELADLLRKEMGYIEKEAPKCANCEHSVERENYHVDRMWDTYCGYNSIGSFQVKPQARCSKFLQRNDD